MHAHHCRRRPQAVSLPLAVLAGSAVLREPAGRSAWLACRANSLWWASRGALVYMLSCTPLARPAHTCCSMVKMPKGLTAATGMDALTHAVEVGCWPPGAMHWYWHPALAHARHS